MWLNELYKRLMGQTSRRIRRRFSLKRTFIRPRLEALEDRTLLSAPAAFTLPTLTSGTQDQFGGGNSTQTGTQFLGATFNNLSQTIGGISDGWGAQANISLNGH